MKLVPASSADGNTARYIRPNRVTRDGEKTIRVVIDLVHEREVLVRRTILALQRTLNARPRADS